MKYGTQIREKTIVEQMASIKMKYANFNVSFNRNSLYAIGEIQPTSRSEPYTVEIKYRFLHFPEINILKPQLIKNFKGEQIPHIYQGEKLCLYQRKYREFKFADYISETVIPWTSLWLYYYEVWHITGEWLGGGEHN